MNERVTGYTLLGIGVVLILFSIISVFLVFTGNTKPAKLFNSAGITFDLSSLVGGNLQALKNVGSPNQPAAKKPAEIIPADLINDSTNIFVHLLLMGFIASGGFKLASLGVSLIRPVVIKLKAKDGTVIPTEK